MIDGIGQRPDDILVPDLNIIQPIRERPACDGDRGRIQLVAKLLHQRPQAPGIEEILHQIGRAGRTDVCDNRRRAADAVKIL
ncbi:hypothetical protein D3C73_520750 [compost metagenome]